MQTNAPSSPQTAPLHVNQQVKPVCMVIYGVAHHPL
jgi:hypothetical protein